jgi:hypothetical protein
MTRIRSGLSYANVMATVAVFLALGGGAYAAIHLPKNSVGSKQIKRNAVTSAKVKNRSLLAADFKAGELPAGGQGVQGPKGDPGPLGLMGPMGAKGDKGDHGDQGVQGPGAIPILATGTSAISGPQPLATVGPWTLTLTCDANTPNAEVRVTGPGTMTSTTSLASGASAATTYVGAPFSLGSGGDAVTVDTGVHASRIGFLQSGSTIYELKFLMSASNGGLFESCPVIGDAIPVPAA